MKTLIATLCACMIFTGCATTQGPGAIIEVKVPVPVYCNIKAPEAPSWPFTDDLTTKRDLFETVKRLLAETKLRQGYELQLEKAIKACNEK